MFFFNIIYVAEMFNILGNILVRVFVSLFFG